MPIELLEQHPYLEYEKKHMGKYTGLVIGSFPIYACSNILDENLNVTQENNIQNKIRFRFFYGSNQSKFWDYVFKAFDNNNPITISNCIKLLEDNKIIITDALYRTNRRAQSSADEDLMIVEKSDNFMIENISLNYGVKDLINKNSGLKNLFFTATGLDGKSPFGWFRRVFEDNLIIEEVYQVAGRIWSFVCIMEERRFNCFMLPTPKTRGIHFTDNQRTLAYCNYLHSRDVDFYNEINNLPMVDRSPNQKHRIKEYRESFLIETYKQALVLNNSQFDGTI